jgi:hypothetical protein
MGLALLLPYYCFKSRSGVQGLQELLLVGELLLLSLLLLQHCFDLQ